MTTYKGINGFAVQSVASDPSPSDEGQVWYNNVSTVWKLSTLTTSGSWATVANVNTTRSQAGTAGDGNTAVIAFGGSTGPTYLNSTEVFNGTSWTTSPATLSTARVAYGGTGTATAAITASGLQAGGGAPNDYATVSQTFNGSAWTSTPSLNTGRREANGTNGSQTAAIVIGGYGAPDVALTNVESWNGSSWTSVTSMGTAGYAVGSCWNEYSVDCLWWSDYNRGKFK